MKRKRGKNKGSVHPANLELKPDWSEGRHYRPEIHDLRNATAKAWAKAMTPRLNAVADGLREAGAALPGEFPLWDKKAWGRLIEAVGRCRCHQPSLMPDEQGPCPLAEYALAWHQDEETAVFFSTANNTYRRL